MDSVIVNITLEMSNMTNWELELMRYGVPRETAKIFIEYHTQNRKVWTEFERKTLDAISRREKVGAKYIIEQIRKESELPNDSGLKVNNNFAPYYARIFSIKYPQHEKYFLLKELHGLRAAA